MEAKTYELIIYGVQYGEVDGEEFVDNWTIENFDDDKFKDLAEQEGNVFTVKGFLRKLEECTYGAESYVDNFYNMTLRAYLINAKNPNESIRVDNDTFLFNITQLQHTSEVI